MMKRELNIAIRVMRTAWKQTRRREKERGAVLSVLRALSRKWRGSESY